MSKVLSVGSLIYTPRASVKWDEKLKLLQSCVINPLSSLINLEMLPAKLQGRVLHFSALI